MGDWGKIFFYVDQNFSPKFKPENSSLHLESLKRVSSVSFPLAVPCQESAFWADKAPFVDVGCLIVIRGNYREPGRSQVIIAFSPDFYQVLDSFCGSRVYEWCRVRSAQKTFRWRGGRSKQTNASQLKLWNSLKLFPTDHFFNNFFPMITGENRSIIIPALKSSAQTFPTSVDWESGGREKKSALLAQAWQSSVKFHPL